MVYYATFNNISVIPWQSVLLVEETGIPTRIYQKELIDQRALIDQKSI
jgi:hypothetical protein